MQGALEFARIRIETQKNRARLLSRSSSARRPCDQIFSVLLPLSTICRPPIKQSAESRPWPYDMHATTDFVRGWSSKPRLMREWG